jgi:hypothetical protein
MEGDTAIRIGDDVYDAEDLEHVTITINGRSYATL